MTSLFLYGTLRFQPLLRLVMGEDRAAAAEPADLAGYRVHWARGECFPLIVPAASGRAQGILLRDLTADDLARLDFYEAGFDYDRRPVTVETTAGPAQATAFFAAEGRWPIGEAWSLDDWARDWGALTLRAAQEVMARFGEVPASEIDRYFPQTRVRAASWVRAQTGGSPVGCRQGFGRDDIDSEPPRRPFQKFFQIEERRLRFRRFDGGTSDPVERCALVSGDAVTVLPYDPARDRVMLVEQFRFGPYVRGDLHPWSLEPIAGRIDPGETPEACAHREAREEAGLTLSRLEPIASYYSSPGSVSEYLYSYIGLADLPDTAAGLGGVADEHEDIRSIVLDFEALMAALRSGEAENGPLLVSVLWLALNRDRLRAGAVGG